MTFLTMKDEKRLKIIQRVFQGEVTVVQAALVLGISERQCYRIKARVKKGGAKGVVHGNRGRPSKRKIKEKTVKRIVELAQGKYQDFNDHHLTDKLEAEEKIELSREKVRRILRAHGIASPNKRRGIKHRSRRERRAAEGMMLQVDGSPHDWLEGRGPRLCLIGAKLARNAQPAWRKVSVPQIQQALCFKERRTVAKDNTITFEGTLFQIPKRSPFGSHSNKRIDVHVLLDGAVEFFHQKEKIASFNSKTTHTLGLYRTNAKREGFRYGPLSSLTTHDTKVSP